MLGLRPWEYYAFDSEEYQLLLKGHDLQDQLQWDKVRTLCYYSANEFKPIKTPKEIMQLPLIDGDAKSGKLKNIDRIKEFIEASKRAKEEKLKQQQQNAPAN